MNVRVRRWFGLWLVAALCMAGGARADSGSTTAWLDRYDVAVHRAIKESKLLILLFHEEQDSTAFAPLEEAIATDAALAGALERYVCVRLPLSATLTPDPASGRLLDAPAFKKLNGQPGIVVLDFAHADAAYYGRPVSVATPLGAPSATVDTLAAIVALPAGNLAERTRILEAKRSEREATEWLDDYAAAYHRARREGKMLLIYFRREGDGAIERFERETLADAEVRQRMTKYVCARLATDALVPASDPPRRLLAERSFQEMLDRPGVAVIDLQNKDAPYYGNVVSTFPLLQEHPYTPARMSTILDLPPGTLTQRTMVYAVRVHPEAPASTRGDIHSELLSEAASHASYQARIRVQGHQGWESRFHRITAKLPQGLLATEVCAESWPGERLVEAALECVRCWRLSSGHWRAVNAFHPVYGYDIKRGTNGIWYATGIFGEGRRR